MAQVSPGQTQWGRFPSAWLTVTSTRRLWRSGANEASVLCALTQIKSASSRRDVIVLLVILSFPPPQHPQFQPGPFVRKPGPRRAAHNYPRSPQTFAVCLSLLPGANTSRSQGTRLNSSGLVRDFHDPESRENGETGSFVFCIPASCLLPR